METVNGPETAKKMREIGYTGPIIGVTGNVLKDDIRNFLKNGKNDLSVDNEYSLRNDHFLFRFHFRIKQYLCQRSLHRCVAVLPKIIHGQRNCMSEISRGVSQPNVVIWIFG
jgi:hypothetical protein